MRPLHLTMQAFGPFLKRVDIPFENLGKSNIYLISGVTGSGKTTIFDAISFALFNRASGSTRDTTVLKSHFANNDTESFVEFTFLFNGEIYKIIRSPMYERKKLRGSGTVLMNSKAQLTLPDSKLIIGAKEVDEYIKNLLGLDASQFSQIALLAQGEFLKLLNADTQKRGEIFRSIFKTQDYSKFSLILKDKVSFLKHEFDNLTNSLLQYFLQIISNDFELDSSIKLCAENNCIINSSEILKLLKNQNEKDEKLLIFFEAEIEKIEKNTDIIKEKLRKIETKTQIISNIKEFENIIKFQKDEFEISKKEYLALDDKKARLDELKILIKQQEDTFKKIQELKTSQNSIQSFKSKKDSLKSKLFELKNEYLSAVFSSYLFLKDELLNAQNDFTKKKIELSALQEAYNTLYLNYLSKQAGILAQDLKDNTPCPVCGSLVHPNPCSIEKSDITADILDESKEKYELESDKLAKLSEFCSVISQKKDLKLKEFETLKKRFNELNFDETLSKPSKYSDDKNLIFENEINNLEKSYNEIESEISKLQNLIDFIIKDLKDIKIENIEEENKKIKDEFNTLSEYIEKIKSNYEKKSAILNDSYSKLELLNKQLAEYDDIDESVLDDVKIEFEKSSDELKNKRDEMQTLNFRRKTNEALYFEIKKTSDNLKQVENKYNEFKILSDCANGTLKGRPRIAFEQYIQGYYLDLVLAQANKHLKTMSKGQFCLLRKKDSVSLQNKSGLDLEVMDFYTFKPRSTRTLSGGESFKAALSLALGLSDVVSSLSGGINIDAMFIDEGFGTLDSESLELALDVIISLIESGRLIGVISHVEDLKNRIQNKILTKKTSEGSNISVNF